MLEIGETTEYVSVPRDTYDDLLDFSMRYQCLYSRMDLLVEEIRLGRQITTDVLLKAINSPYADRVYKELYETKGVEDIEQD